jgi:hypothetical protein
MADRVESGACVEIRQVVLEPGERAPQVPDDTQRVRLELRVRGRLTAPGAPGEEVEIETRAGRRLRGTLADASPAYHHGFGAPVPELSDAAEQARAILAQRRGDTSK